jgi:hypothetical protein
VSFNALGFWVNVQHDNSGQYLLDSRSYSLFQCARIVGFRQDCQRDNCLLVTTLGFMTLPQQQPARRVDEGGKQPINVSQISFSVCK